jgi:hypothetical protein
MKIQVDGKTVYELNETQKKVIQNDIYIEIFQEDIERRARWVIEHKYERCFERLKNQWEPILRNRISSIPTDPDQLAELIFSQPDYKNRSQRESEIP